MLIFFLLENLDSYWELYNYASNNQILAFKAHVAPLKTALGTVWLTYSYTAHDTCLIGGKVTNSGYRVTGFL